MTFANYSQVSKVLKTFAHVTYFYVICTKAYPIVLEYMPPSRNLSANNIGNLNASGKRPFTGKEFSVFARIIVQSCIVDSLIFIGTWAERATFSTKGKTLPFFQNRKFCFKL